jgi:hypothetical protein
MPTDWSEENCDALPQSKREAGCSREAEQAAGFPLELDKRERMELVHLLEQSLTDAAGERALSGDSAAICRALLDKIRMLGG